MSFITEEEESRILTGDLPSYHPIIPYSELELNLISNSLIYRFLQRETFSVMAGPPASSKSFLALDIALSIANPNKQFFMDNELFPIAHGSVVYISCEGNQGFINRIEAYKKQNELPATIPFGLINKQLNLRTDEELLKTLVYKLNKFEEFTKQKLQLVIIDTLNRVMAGGDENSSIDMSQMVANIDKIQKFTNSHICVLHHLGKDAERGSRGHSSLKGAIDTELMVNRNKNTNVCTLRITKQKDLDSLEPITYKLNVIPLGVDDWNQEVSSCVVAYDEYVGPEENVVMPQSHKEKAVFKKNIVVSGIKRYYERTGEYPRLFVLKDEIMDQLSPGTQTPEAKRKMFERTVKSLIEEKIIKQEQNTSILSLVS